MAFVHKLITGGEQWLPFALSKLRAMDKRLGGTGYGKSNFVMPDGATVTVSASIDQHFVRIDGGATYEFFTSEHISDDTLTSPGRADYHIPGSATRMTGKKASPLFSSALVPPADKDPPSWELRAVDAGTESGTPKYHLKTWGSWQDQKFFAYPYWPGNGRKELVTSCQSQAPGWNSQCNWLSAGAAGRIEAQSVYTADYGRDILPTYYFKDQWFRGAPDYSQPWVWWRHSAVQHVSSEATGFGGSFFICSDNAGRFQIYRAKNYADPFLLDATQYKEYTPPYPAWVTPLDPDDYTIQKHHWLWAFDSKAERAVCCPFHSETSQYYKHLEKSIGCVLPSELSQVNEAPGSMILGFEDTPGLVEIGIEIVVTGNGDMDFTANLTLLRSDYFLDSGRYIFDAAYALPDKSKGAPEERAGVHEDTLVTAEIVCKTAPGDYDAGPSGAGSAENTEWAYYVPALYFGPSVVNMRTSVVINQNDEFLAPAKIREFLADAHSSRRFKTFAGRSHIPIDGVPDYNDNITNYIHSSGDYLTILPDEFGQTTHFFQTNSSVYNRREVDTDPQPTVVTWIYSMELRTLSFMTKMQNFATGKWRSEIIHYNQLVEALGDPAAEFVIAAPQTAQVPVSGVGFYAERLPLTLSTAWGCGFSVHPVGHWSHCIRASEGTVRGVGDTITLPADPDRLPTFYDIIQVKGGERTSHKTMFNKAFNQTRGYSFYREYFPEMRYWDIGTFRTAGFWITF